jgi:cell wall-associated NlpC family hydrolase
MNRRVKRKLVLLMAVALALSTPVARATEEQEETFGDKLKKLFVRPTPKPKARKKKKPSPSPAASQSPNAGETPVSSTPPSEAASATPAEQTNETPAPTAEMKSPTPTAAEKTGTQYFEAVRPITPHGGRRRSPAARSTPAIVATPVPESPVETEPSRPMPSLPPLTSPSPSPPPLHTPAPSVTAARTPSPIAQKAPSAGTPIDEISDSSSYSPEVRKIVDLSLDLTTKNLGYKYVSADPKNGGMDSSGFIYYVLTQSGAKDAPRDAREQYIWVRKAGNFQAVLAQRDDTFELDALKPGDLLFWATNFGTSREPEISQTMIYLGREKGTNHRLMVGASESRSSKGQKKSGVGIFEFKVGRAAPKSKKEETGPVFVGYGRIPGLAGK